MKSCETSMSKFIILHVFTVGFGHESMHLYDKYIIEKMSAHGGVELLQMSYWYIIY